MARKLGNPGKTPVTGDVWTWDGSNMSLMAPPSGAAVTANFTQPVPTQSVTASLSSTRWMTVGMIVYISNGGYYEVTAVGSITAATLKNLGYSGNRVENSTILAGNGVVAAGLKGVDGKGIISASVDPSAGDGSNGDYWYNQNTYTFFGPKSGGAWPAGISTKGADGKNIELQVSATHIQWRKVGDTAWTNLIAFSSLQGAQGPQGPDNIIRFNVSNGPNVFRRLVTLPSSNDGTYDETIIQGSFGGWGAGNKTTFFGRFSNRAAFTYHYWYIGQQTQASIRAYQQADGSVVVGLWTPVTFSSAGLHVFSSQVYADTSATQISPSGTLIFDSANQTSYPASWRLDDGGFRIETGLVSTRRFSTALTAMPSGYLSSRNALPIVRANDTGEEHKVTWADFKAFLSATSTLIPDQSGSTSAAFSLNLALYFSDPTGHPLSYSVSGNPGGTSAASNGVFNGTPAQAGTFNVLVTVTDIMSWTYTRSFVFTVIGSAVNKLYYDWDSGTKGYWAYAQVSDISTSVAYEVLLTPLSGQSGAPAATYRTMEGGSWTLGGVTYNRRYQYPPASADAAHLNPPGCRQPGRKVSDTNVARQADVQLIAGSNSSADITNNSPYVPPGNNPPVWGSIPNQTFSRKRAASYTVPAATDPEGGLLSYSITGLPDGLSFNPSSRQISGIPTTLGTYLVTITATDPAGQSAGQSFYIIVAVSLCSDFRQYTSGDNVGSSSLVYEYNNGSGYPRAFASTDELVTLMNANTSVNFDFVRVTGGNWASGSRIWGTNNPTIIDNANANPGTAPSPALYNVDEAGWWARNPVYSGGVLQSVDMYRTDTCGYIVEIQAWSASTIAPVVGSATIFNPSVQWSAGKAQVINSASPSIPSGYTLYYWTDGSTPTTSLPASYDYDTGDVVTIYAAITNNPDPIQGNFSAAYSVIQF